MASQYLYLLFKLGGILKFPEKFIVVIFTKYWYSLSAGYMEFEVLFLFSSLGMDGGTFIKIPRCSPVFLNISSNVLQTIAALVLFLW